MRITVNIPDNVYRAARSLGDALAELVRRQFGSGHRIDTRKAFPTFVVSNQAQPITLEHTLSMEDEL